MAGPGSLIPRGGWMPPARRPPDIYIPRAADDVVDDLPDIEANPPRRIEGDTPPRAIDEASPPRDGRFDGEWEDVNTPWYKNPLTAVPAAMVGGLGYLWSLMGGDGQGITDTGGTADLHEEQAPLPGTKKPMDLKARAAAGNEDAIRYLKQKEDGRARFRQMAMWAGGSQNLGRHNIGFYNMLYDLPPEERQKVIMDNMPMNPLRAEIEAANQERAAELAQKAVSGMVGRVQNPLAEAAAEAELPDEERALLHKDERQIHPSEIAAVDKFVADRYSTPYPPFGTSSSFTIQERQETVDYLVGQGYTPEKAQRLVDHVARVRETQDWQ